MLFPSKRGSSEECCAAPQEEHGISVLWKVILWWGFLFISWSFFFLVRICTLTALYLRVDQVDVVDDSRLKFDLDA